MRVIFLLGWLFPAIAMAADGLPVETTTALLESSSPEQVERVADAADSGELMISGSDCLDAEQRYLIEANLLKSARIRQVSWQLPCADNFRPVAFRVAVKEEQVAVLPEKLLFQPLYADPREARFGVRYQQHRLNGWSFKAADVALGGYLGLATSSDEPSASWQVGVQGAVFALFNLDADSSDLINADYWIGIPFSYRKGNWSVRTRLYHQSSHLGDEYIMRNLATRRLNLSYEVIDSLLAYDWGNGRVFGGGGYILHTLHDQARGQLQYGAEFTWPRVIGQASLIAAGYFQNLEEQDWHLNQSYRLGFTVKRGVREAGLLLAHYQGYAPDGQFYDEELKYTGIELFYRL